MIANLRRSNFGAVTYRRFRAVLTSPADPFRNFRYHFGLTRSPMDHIFVLGPPRSGTTLLKQIIWAHSEITGFDKETWFFLRWNIRDFRTSLIAPEQMQRMVSSAKTTVQLFDLIADELKQRCKAVRFVEKSPEHVLRLRFLKRYYPNAQFVFIVRDGRDGFLSARRNSRMVIKDLEGYARLWRKCVAARVREGHGVNLFDVRYEALCANPSEVIRDLMTFLDLPFQKEQITPDGYSHTVLKELAGHERLALSIGADTVGEWRTKLTASEVVLFNRIAGRELRLMGYEV
jgi:protein-tyrosine sulfotransferase